MNTEEIKQEFIDETLRSLEQVSSFTLAKNAFVRNIKSAWGAFLVILASPIYLLILPVKAFTWAVVAIKTHRYDPEKRMCVACGFKGDSGTDGKSCRIAFVVTSGIERAAIQHICFRCGCDKQFSKLVVPADKWIPKKD